MVSGMSGDERRLRRCRKCVWFLVKHFSSSPFLWRSQVWLQRALQSSACHRPSTEWERWGRLAGTYVHLVVDGLQWDPIWHSSYHLHSSKLSPCWADREVVWVMRECRGSHYLLFDMAALLSSKGRLKQQPPPFHIDDLRYILAAPRPQPATPTGTSEKGVVLQRGHSVCQDHLESLLNCSCLLLSPSCALWNLHSFLENHH